MHRTSNRSPCHQCSAAVDAGAGGELCARCLLEQGLAEVLGLDEARAVRERSPSNPKF